MQDADYCCLPLKGRQGISGYVLVDSEDRALLARKRWTLHSGYAAHAYMDGDDLRVILMHRMILGLERGDERQGDHINRDTLDNRRSNLRIVTSAQNSQNKAAYRGGSSRFRGVHWDKDGNRWRAGGSISGRTISLGSFASEIAAARAAEEWRTNHMPFAMPDPELAKLRAVA